MSASDAPRDAAGVENLVGRRLAGRYLLIERIGQGGMAAVYRANDEQLGRDVALKVFHPGLTSPDDLRRQEGEVRHLAALTHPNLVTLYDAISEDGPGFLVLEYVRGPDLRARLKAGPLSPAVVAAVGCDIARALAYIHGRNLVHRDVSPGNILLPEPAPQGHGVAAKLTDLGIARVLDTAQVTLTGTVIGTAAYVSPEQVRGDVVSAASDIYSLGLVLLEALTGQRAFDGPAMESAVARLHRDPDTVTHVPTSWRRLLAAMTAREPADRPTAAQVADALADPALGTDPEATALLTAPLLAAEPSARGVTIPAWVRRVPTRWLLLAAAGVVVLVWAIWAMSGTGHSTSAPPAPTYPAVPGQLGTHLKQLEHDVAP